MRLLIEEQDTTVMDDEALTALRGKYIGFVFQYHHLISAFTALENVMMPMLVGKGFPDRAMRDRAANLLDRREPACCWLPSSSILSNAQTGSSR